VSPVRVLYVGGTGRSGSTLLANVLGELPCCVSVGELRFVWERGMLEDRLCGCGVAFSACPFWREVLRVAFDGRTPDPARMSSIQRQALRGRNLPRLVATRRRPQRLISGLDDLPAALSRLYRAVSTVSGADVVVDSSKLPTFAVLVDSIPDVDLTLLHLVRDPRAAAFSWRRVKAQPDRRAEGASMERRGVGKSVGLWMAWNLVLEAFWRGRRSRYLRVTYEEFVLRAGAVIGRVGSDLGLPPGDPAVVVGDGTVRLGTSHTVAGNPGRLRSGSVRLALDDEWRAAMPLRDRLAVTIGAAPLMRRYGYPLRIGAGSG